MSNQSRTKRATHTHASRNALYLLLAFCGGLISPVLVLLVLILNKPPLSLNEFETPEDSIVQPDPIAPSTDIVTAQYDQNGTPKDLDLSTLPQVYVDTNHDVYYIAFDPTYNGPESTLIAAAEYPPTCPGADGTSFCQKQYHRATISPNGKWVFLEGACWEESCYSVYNLADGKQYALTTSPLDTHWLPDNRLRGDGGFATPLVIPSGAWESISSTEPWRMQKVSE